MTLSIIPCTILLTGFVLDPLFISCSSSSFVTQSCFPRKRWSRMHRRRETNPAIIRPSTSSALQMALDIKIRIVGRKNGCERWLSDAYDMYETRLQSSNINVETIWHKNNEELVKAVKTDSSKDHSVVLLDVRGNTMTSEEFSKSLYQWLLSGGSRVAFIIGGADGLPLELKQEFQSNMISLSSMTFTHQFARTMLVEQIYRASEIEKGSNYHK